MAGQLILLIRNAVDSGRLDEPFNAAMVHEACPGYAKRTYRVFLPKHAEGNGSTSELFVRVEPAVRHFERQMYDGSDLYSGARFFTKDAFEKIGGFDESVVAGDDYDINNRLRSAGLRVCWISAAELHLGEPATLLEIARKSYFYGSLFGPFVRKSGVRGIAQLSPFRASYLRHWRDFAAHPVLGFGLVAMQAVKYACGAAGFIRANIGGTAHTVRTQP